MTPGIAEQIGLMCQPLPLFFQCGGVGSCRAISRDQHQKMPGFQTIAGALQNSAKPPADPVSDYGVSDPPGGDISHFQGSGELGFVKNAEHQMVSTVTFPSGADLLKDPPRSNPSAPGNRIPPPPSVRLRVFLRRDQITCWRAAAHAVCNAAQRLSAADASGLSCGGGRRISLPAFDRIRARNPC